MLKNNEPQFSNCKRFSNSKTCKNVEFSQKTKIACSLFLKKMIFFIAFQNFSITLQIRTNTYWLNNDAQFSPSSQHYYYSRAYWQIEVRKV